MSDLNNNIEYTSGIDKFDGSFERESLGCTIFVNETVNMIKDLDVGGLYMYLVCRPPSWKLNVKHLTNLFNCGKDKIYRILDSLISLGLLVRAEIREAGKFKEYKYRILLRPNIKQNVQTAPFPEKPEAVKPDPVKPDTYKTKNIENKDINTTTTSSTTSFENYKEQEKKNLEEVNEQFNRKQKEEEFKKDSLNDSQCKRIFQQRFSGLDITLEELYQECVDYWSQSNQMVFKARFLTHLKKAPIEKYTALSAEKSNSIPKNETQEERMKRYALERENQKKRING